MAIKLVALKLPNGKWLSRGRFSDAWDGAFELDHPEFFSAADEKEEKRIDALVKARDATPMAPEDL